MELGILTEHTSGLGQEAAQRLGLGLWDPAREGLEEALERLLPLYDRVLLLLSRPPFGPHLALGQALARKHPNRLLLHATPLFGPGLAALAERAAEEAGRWEPKEVPAELLRMEQDWKERKAFQEALQGLKPERGVFGPQVWEEALGSRALLGFAYPL